MSGFVNRRHSPLPAGAIEPMFAAMTGSDGGGVLGLPDVFVATNMEPSYACGQ